MTAGEDDVDQVRAGAPADRGAVGGSFQDEVINQSIDAIIVIDDDLIVRLWSPGAERVYAIPAAVAIGRPIGDILVAHELDGTLLDGVASRLSLEKNEPFRQRLIHRPRIGGRSGSDIVIDSVVTVLRGQDGSVTGLLGINRDVTETTQLEAEIAALAALSVLTDGDRSQTAVASAALEILCRAIGADAGLITSTEAGYEALASIGLTQRTIDVILAYGQLGGPLATALEPPNAFISADLATAPLREDVREAVLADGIRHLVVVEMRPSATAGGRLTGLLALGWRSDHPVEPSRAILVQAAALVGSSIENARLLGAVERGLTEERRLTRRMRALVELTRLPVSIQPDQPREGAGWITQLMSELGAILGARAATYARVIGDNLVLEAVNGMPWDAGARLMSRPVSQFPLFAEPSGHQSAVLLPVGSPWLSDTARDVAEQQGFQSGAILPIHDAGRLDAVIMCAFGEELGRIEIDDRTLEAIGRVLDISFANRRFREVIEANERRYRELFDLTPEALLVQTMDEEIVDANRAAFELYGPGIVGRHVSDLSASEPVRIDPAFDRDDVIRGTGIGRREDGSTFPEEFELRVTDIGGERRTLAIVRDLTERSRLQAELAQAQKMDAIGMLVAGVAHELNNPLAAIVGFSHLLRTDPSLPTDLRGQADLLVQEANRTRVIVQNLLDFARLRPPERVEMDLQPLIDSVLGLQSYVLAQNRLTVDVDLPPDLPRVSVDRSQMQQVLINLTVNASQAITDSGRPGTIRISGRADTAPSGPIVRIEIADDGPGVPPEILDRLFLPFVTTKAPGKGTGLGLSVSFGIIKSHGGTLRHRPSPGGGATFLIELPAATGSPIEAGSPAGTDRRSPPPRSSPDDRNPVVEEADPPTVPLAAGADPAPPALALRVLVLGDEPSIREFLGRVLEREGYEPILADTGPAALDILRRDMPDAILCDHRMAGMSGTEFLAAIVAIESKLARRFAFMSGDVLNPELRDFASEHGVQLLAKPFDIAVLTAVVTSLVAGGRA